MRLPVFHRLLMGPPIPGPSEIAPLDLAILAVAPRSYWKSTHRSPTEAGLLSDYTHILNYTTRRFPDSNVVLYGHSLGGAISLCLTSRLRTEEYPNVKGLILENPFASIPGMVKALYPQKWLPYHHLGPLAFDRWDALSAVRNASPDTLAAKLAPMTMMLLSEHDELVPNVMGEALFEASAGLVTKEDGRRRVVKLRNALHENAWQDRRWLTEMRKYIQAAEA